MYVFTPSPVSPALLLPRSAGVRRPVPLISFYSNFLIFLLQHVVAIQQPSAPAAPPLPPQPPHGPAAAATALPGLPGLPGAVQAPLASPLAPPHVPAPAAAPPADCMLVPLIAITMTPPRGPTGVLERAPAAPRTEEVAPAASPQAPATSPVSAAPAEGPDSATAPGTTMTSVHPRTGQHAMHRRHSHSNGQTASQPSLPPQSALKRSPKDFIFGKVIGEGSFSMVSVGGPLTICDYIRR